MDSILCWQFPHANKAKRRSHQVSSSAQAKRQWVSTSSRNWGRQLSFGSWPRRPEMKPATGSKNHLEYQCQGSRLKTFQGAQSSLDQGWRDEVPSTATSPYLLLSLEVPALAFFLAELAADGIWFSFWQQCWWQEGIFPVPRGCDSYSKSETTHTPKCDTTQHSWQQMEKANGIQLPASTSPWRHPRTRKSRKELGFCRWLSVCSLKWAEFQGLPEIIFSFSLSMFFLSCFLIFLLWEQSCDLSAVWRRKKKKKGKRLEK